MLASVAITYPADRGRVVVRTDRDWARDVEPVEVSADGTRSRFEIETDAPLVRLKPCLHAGTEFHWMPGPDFAIPVGAGITFEMHPHFHEERRGRVTSLVELRAAIGVHRAIRAYLPAGYHENELARYPVIYMQDGANLFLPAEAPNGADWRVDETMDILDGMHLVRRAIVVGLYAQERMTEYTEIGYEAYGRSLRDRIKPWIDDTLRTRPGPEDTVVVGSSLGGVVSFYLGWEWPEVFGNVACLSSSFGWRDDLFERVRRDPVEPRRRLKVYLDSGWPGDNFAETLAMAAALAERGFVFGRDFLHFAFPLGEHHEREWAGRMHLPIQFLCGHARRLSLELQCERPTDAPRAARAR